MQPLAVFLLAILLVSAAFFFMIRKLEDPDSQRLVKKLIVLYAWMVSVILSVVIIYFIGLDRSGTPRLPIEKQRRISHLGYYVNPESSFVFTSRPGEHTFQHVALEDGDSLVLKPSRDRSTGRAENWTLRFKSLANPVRVGGRCVNLSEDCWVSSGDTLYVFYKSNSKMLFSSIRFIAREKWYGRIENEYYFDQGQFTDSGLVYDQTNRDVIFSKNVYTEGRKLAVMFRYPYKDFKEKTPTLDSVWWSIAENITLIREQKGDKISRMGFLINDSLFVRPDIALYKNSLRLLRSVDWKEIKFPFNSEIAYGFEEKGSFSLKVSDKVIKDPLLGRLIETKSSYPASWALPDSLNRPFIITSSSGYITMDGYQISVVGSHHPFYAKATLDLDKDTIVVNDGAHKRAHRLGDVIRLGDYQQGVLIVFEESRASLVYTGKYQIAILFFLTIGFTIITLNEKHHRPHLDASWACIWGIALTILTIRMLLAYRVSLFPPLDAAPKELQNVFHKSLEISLYGFILIPLGLLLARFLSDLEIWNTWKATLGSILSRFWPFKNITVAILLASFVIIGWIALALLIGDNESISLFGFFSFRINLGMHILLIFLTVLTAKQVTESEESGPRILLLAFIFSCTLSMMLLVGDAGFGIFLLSFAIYGLCLLRWDSTRVSVLSTWVPLLLIMGILLMRFFPLVGTVEKIVDPRRGDVFYRFVTFTESREDLLLSTDTESGLRMDNFLRNSHQDWQMRLYAAEGCMSPKGYGGAVLSKKGMTYPTSVSDCVFSIYLLSEHGRFSALFLIICYLFLGIGLLFAGWSFPGETGPTYRSLPLTAIGTFFVFNALYMASANLGLAVFTGQNVPLLALNSQSDLIHCGIMLVISTVLLTQGQSTSSASFSLNHPDVRATGISFLLACVLWLAYLAYRMFSIPSYYRDDHDFPPAVFRQMEDNLPTPKVSKPWKLVGDKLIRTDFGGDVLPIEELLVKSLDGRRDKFDEKGGVYFLEKSGQQNVVKLNRNYFKLVSPFRKVVPWKGLIVASGGERELSVQSLNEEFKLGLTEKGHAETIALTQPFTGRANKAVNLKEGRGSQSPIFCELIRQGDSLEIWPKSDRVQPGKRWNVYVDGLKIDSAKVLQKYAIIVIESGEFRANLIYLGKQPSVLAFVQWRNGKETRVFPGRGTFPMSFALGKAADLAVANGKKLLDTLHLALNLSLHRSLQDKIEEYVRNDSTYSIADPAKRDAKRIALTVIDAHSGDILALPYWPFADPSDPKFQEDLDKLPRSLQAKILQNQNLTNHAIGSTIKPIIFATLASKFWPRDISKLVVYNNADSTSSGEDGIMKHWHTNLGAIRIDPPWDCHTQRAIIDADNFLIHSLDYYVGVLGMMGMFLDKEQDWHRAVITSLSRPGISYQGSNYDLDMTRVMESPFSLVNYLPRPRTEAMNRTLLFSGLPQLFETQTSGDIGNVLIKSCKLFAPFYVGDSLNFKSNKYLDDFLPQPILLDPVDFQGIRQDLISFFLGSGNAGRWNNVRMAEAMSRLILGVRTNARLERPSANSTGYSQLENGARSPMPQPISIVEWRRDHLVNPFKEVGRIGTARGLRDLVQPPFVAVYKTGTIQESHPNRESEMLMFMIGRWVNGDFMPGRTIAGYFYMQDSKSTNGEAKKLIFAREIIPPILDYLRGLDIGGN